MNQMSKITNIGEIEFYIKEVQQPRSKFQLEKFVIGQHPTDEMKFYQTCLELNDMIYKYKVAEIQIEKNKIKIERLLASNDEVDALEAKELQLGLEQTEMALFGASREIQALLEIYDSFEIKYDRSAIEANQYHYWKSRLAGNAKAMLIGGVSVNPAHIESMQQAGILDEFVAEVQESRKELGL